MELLTTKIIALTLLGALSLFFGLLPLRLRRYLNQGSKKRERITSCLLCFGGGVLLATVFIHMLPETREGFNGAFAMGYLSVGGDYPLAELVVCAGFFLIYVVEEFVHKMTRVAGADHRSSNHSHHHHHHNGHHHHHHHHRHSAHKLDTFDSEKPKRESGRCSVYSITEAVKKASVSNPPEAFTIKNKWAETGVDNPVFAGDTDAMSWNPALKESIVTSSQVMPTTNQETTELSTSAASAGGAGPELQSNGAATLGHSDHHTQEHSLGGPHSNGSHGHANCDAGGHSHIEITKLFSKGLGSNLRSVIIVLALSIHSVFEGLAVGLQERRNDVWYLFGAIAAHKFVIAFCLGVKLLTSMSVGLMVIYMVVLALVTPLGIAIGIIITETASTDPGAHSVLVTILQGLAGGTILYVTFFEILERERARDGGRLMKMFCVCLGFVAMASVETIGGHSHGPPVKGNAGGHGHSHSHSHFHGDHDGHDHSGHDHDFFMDTTPLMAEHAFDSTEAPLKFLPDIPHEDHGAHSARDVNNNNLKAVSEDSDALHSGHDHGPALSGGDLTGLRDHSANAPGIHPEGNARGFHSHEETGVHSSHGHGHEHGHEHHSHSH